MIPSERTRNQKIAAALREGKMVRDVACAFGLSSPRVCQIAREYGIPKKVCPPPPARVNPQDVSGSQLVCRKRLLRKHRLIDILHPPFPRESHP